MKSGATRPQVMVMDLESTGHHAGYIQNLIHCYALAPRRVRLTFLVGSDFPEWHPGVVEQARDTDGVALEAVSPEEDLRTPRGLGPLRRRLLPAENALREWRTLCRHAERLSAHHVMSLYVDRLLQVPMALHLTAPCTVSGIYFRPTFHYKDFEGPEATTAEKLRAFRQQAMIQRAMAHPALGTLFTLDWLAAERLGRPAAPLADPVKTYDTPPDARERLREAHGVGDRLLLLLFGMLTRRKGVVEVLDGISILPAGLRERVSVALLGPRAPEDAADIRAAVARARASGPVHIIEHDAFIRDADIQPWFEACDVVLAPYQRHVGMSAVLVRAAAAGRPVIASDYGLMGELVRQHRLGMAVAAGEAGALSDGIARALTRPASEWSDTDAMASFAAGNTPERFAEAIFTAVSPSLPPRSSWAR